MISQPTHWWDSVAATDPLTAQAGTSLTRFGSGGQEPQTEIGTGPNSQDVVHFVDPTGYYRETMPLLFDRQTGTCSVSVFLNADSFTASSPIPVGQVDDDGTTQLWSIVFDSNRLQCTVFDAGSPLAATYSGTFAIDTWYHVVVVFRAGVVDAWIDGVQVLTGVTPTTILPLPVDPADLAWDGTIANHGVWQDVALVQSDVDYLYNGGLGRQYSELSFATLLQLNDFGVTHSSYALPLISTLYNGWRCSVGHIHQPPTTPVTVTASGSDTIVGFGPAQSSVALSRPDVVVGFEADAGRNQWIVAVSGVPNYIEVYSANAQSPMSGAIGWTFLPMPGQDVTPILFSISGLGNETLTPTFSDVRYNLSVQLLVTHNIAANNSDTSFTILSQLTGTGLEILPEIRDAFTSPRLGLFQKTFTSFGLLNADAGDTLSYLASYQGQGASVVDLDEMFLIVEV